MFEFIQEERLKLCINYTVDPGYIGRNAGKAIWSSILTSRARSERDYSDLDAVDDQRSARVAATGGNGILGFRAQNIISDNNRSIGIRADGIGNNIKYRPVQFAGYRAGTVRLQAVSRGNALLSLVGGVAVGGLGQSNSVNNIGDSYGGDLDQGDVVAQEQRIVAGVLVEVSAGND